MVSFEFRQNPELTLTRRSTRARRLFRERIQCVRTYAKDCLSAFSKQVTGLLLRGISSQIKFICTTDRPTMLSRAKCGNSDLPHDHDCVDAYVSTLKGTMSLPVDERIPMLCW